MIYVRTCAYNAEKTLRRAMDSVLNQTYGELTYYVLDNGSTDRTGEILREYAEKDSRVVPFFNKINRNYNENLKFWLISQNLRENDKFCVLDADDAYDLTFLEEIASFMNEYHLDIAACGTRFINVMDGMICGEKVLPQNRILYGEVNFNEYFAEVHWNLRQAWGKVYTAKAAKARYEMELPEWFPKAYGGDTVNVYECVKASDAIGVYAKTLHSYYMSPKSVSYKWIEGREDADEVLFNKSVELLLQKCGFVSESNLNFLYVVYYNGLKDTFNVLFRTEQAPERKLELVEKIMGKSVTKELLKRLPQNEKLTFMRELVQRLLLLELSTSGQDRNRCYDFLVSFTEQFSQLISREKFADFLKESKQIIEMVALGRYQQVMESLLLMLKEGQGSQRVQGEWIELGLNIAALCEREDAYIIFSKKLILWKWENGQQKDAMEEWNEWKQMLPQDKELEEIGKKIKKSSKV